MINERIKFNRRLARSNGLARFNKRLNNYVLELQWAKGLKNLKNNDKDIMHKMSQLFRFMNILRWNQLQNFSCIWIHLMIMSGETNSSIFTLLYDMPMKRAVLLEDLLQKFHKELHRQFVLAQIIYKSIADV